MTCCDENISLMIPRVPGVYDYLLRQLKGKTQVLRTSLCWVSEGSICMCVEPQGFCFVLVALSGYCLIPLNPEVEEHTWQTSTTVTWIRWGWCSGNVYWNELNMSWCKTGPYSKCTEAWHLMSSGESCRTSPCIFYISLIFTYWVYLEMHLCWGCNFI